MIKKLLVLTAGAFVFAVSAQAQSQADSVFVRAQRMVSDGNPARGRALVDSMLRTSRRGSPAYAEALFWRATLAATSQRSEQDYRQLIVEYPLYARTGDVLLRLAQLELLRGNRDAAAVHLRRIQTEHPEFGNQAAASYWMGRVLFEKNDVPDGCAAFAEARRLVKADDVELKNQIDYQGQQCVGVPTTQAVAPIATAPDPAPVTKTPPPVPVEENRAVSDATGVYSIQVAAYNKKADATSLSSKLSKRGFAVRVDGVKAPYRVRIGRYSTRAEATAAQQRIRRSGVDGIVVKVD